MTEISRWSSGKQLLDALTVRWIDPKLAEHIDNGGIRMIHFEATHAFGKPLTRFTVFNSGVDVNVD